MVARNREFLYAIARGRRRSHDHRTKNPSPAQRPGADPGTAGRTAGGIPPGCVPLGAGRNIARYPKPAAPQGGPGRIHRHAAGLYPGLGGARPPGRARPCRGFSPRQAFPGGAAQAAVLAAAPACGAGAFCRAGCVAAGQGALPGAASFGARAVAVPAAVPAPAGGLFSGVGHPVLSAAHPPAPAKNSPGSSGGVHFMLPRWRAAPTPGFGTAGPRGRRSPAPPGGRAPCRRAPQPSW